MVFIHAWGQPNPQAYGGWIEHLARKGNLVLFPKYQEVNRTRPADASASAAGLVKDALAALADDADAKPDMRKVAVVGHLAGSGRRDEPCRDREGEGPAAAGPAFRPDARRHRVTTRNPGASCSPISRTSIPRP